MPLLKPTDEREFIPAKPGDVHCDTGDRGFRAEWTERNGCLCLDTPTTTLTDDDVRRLQETLPSRIREIVRAKKSKGTMDFLAGLVS